MTEALLATSKPSPIRAWLLRAIGLALFGFILVRIDYRGAFALLRTASPIMLLGSFLLIFPMVALKTLRWRRLQQIAGVKTGSFEASYLAYLMGMYAGLVTPGRVGELVRVKYLTDEGAPLAPALSTVLWDRLIDVGGLLFMGLIALLPVAREFPSLYRGLLLLVLTLSVGIPWLLAGGGSLGRRVRSAMVHIVARAGGPGRRVLEIGRALAFTLQRMGPGVWAGLSALTVAGWLVYYLQAWMLARTIGIGLGFFPLIVSVTAAAVAAFIPVSISGLGTRDAAMVLLFKRFGGQGEQAVALSTLVFLTLVANAGLGLWAAGRLGKQTGRGRKAN